MITIHKHEVSFVPFRLSLPKGARFLSVQSQGETPQSWWLVDSGAPVEDRTFVVYGTGYTIENADRMVFLGTFQLHGGSFVGHLFEERL